MIGNPFQGGLLGMGGLNGLAPEPQGLLGQYYDQDAVRKATIKNMLMLGGLGLMGGGWEGAAKGAATAAISTPNQYRDMAMDAYTMDRQGKQDAREDEKWGMEKGRWDAVKNLTQGIDDPLVQAFPEQYAEAQFNSRYGAPSDPIVKTYRDGDQEVTVQWNGQGWDEIGRGAAFKTTPDTVVNTGEGMKLTEGQSKDIGYYARGRLADKNLEQQEKSLLSLQDSAASSVPMIGNYLVDPKYQEAKRNAAEFLAVILRKDTGAAITNEEFRLYGPMYLPMPGDNAQTVAAKRVARKQALDAIRLGGGTARPLFERVDQELGFAGADAGSGTGEYIIEEIP
jgi:hypothetical protein